MHSIRVKITAITIAVILTSILCVTGACFYTIKAETNQSSAEMMNLLCKTTQQTLDEYLTSIEQSVEMAANIASDTLDSIVLVEGGAAGAAAKERPRTPEQAEKLDRHLAEHCAKVQEAFSSVATHTQGVVTYYYCITSEVSENEHGFFYSMVGKTGFEEQPPLIASELDPEDIEHTTWFYTPIQRGRPSWVGPYTAHFLGEKWTVSYLVPIYKAGTLIGVLGMDIFLDTLVDLVRPIRVYDTGYACLFGADGVVLYHPDFEIGSRPEGQDIFVPEEMFHKENSGDEIIRYTSGGVERQMAFSTLSSGMKLVVTAPVQEIMAPWIRLTRIILAAAAVIVIIFAVILMLAMGIITLPLQRLTAASQRLADGDYDVELRYHGQDEVGTLTKAFMQMRDHIRQYVSDLNRRVYTDDLTGLPNMRSFFNHVEEERRRMLEAGGHPALLYFDLNGMKFYNRQYGFSEGNRLICAVADILRRHYGEDNCARFAQDHFVVITDEAGLEDTLAEVFRDCLEANEHKSLPVRVGIFLDRIGSVGVSVACDRAKYACDLNRGTYVSDWKYFDSDMLNQFENNRYIISSLDRALQEGWIKVFYQPIVRAANGRVCDEEALSRWFDPIKGFLSPDQFIPVLERARLIYKLDLYVLDQILMKMQDMKRQGLYVVPQSLNLSRADFEACDIVEEICRRTDAAGIPHEKLTIEVTESMVGSDFEFMREQVERLHALGFEVWMDDFGSGYSSLDVLQSIRFDVLKLDMRFMKRFDEGEESKIILTEMIKMAVALGIDTVAEGVETKEQADFLREVGCTKLQGYYFCKAIPMEEIVERNRKGIQIGFENPDETGYYSAIGRINLYDLGSLANDSEMLGNYFDILPMAVIESDDHHVQIVRCNKSYREFMVRIFGGIEVARQVDYDNLLGSPGGIFAKAVAQCREDDARVFIDEKLPDGSTIHAMLRYVATNPVNGVVSCVAVVLGITNPAGERSH